MKIQISFFFKLVNIKKLFFCLNKIKETFFNEIKCCNKTGLDVFRNTFFKFLFLRFLLVSLFIAV